MGFSSGGTRRAWHGTYLSEGTGRRCHRTRDQTFLLARSKGKLSNK